MENRWRNYKSRWTESRVETKGKMDAMDSNTANAVIVLATSMGIVPYGRIQILIIVSWMKKKDGIYKKLQV